MVKTIILFLAAYLAGSINFSILIFKLINKEDPRKKYSGNAGTFNVFRQAGILIASFIFFLDIGRAVGINFIAFSLLSKDYVPLIGFGLVLGNCYPCFHAFKGGKGVASYLGFNIFLYISTLTACILWCLAYKFFKIAFIGSFVMIFTIAIGAVNFYNYQLIPFFFIIITLLLIIYRHKQNISNRLKVIFY